MNRRLYNILITLSLSLLLIACSNDSLAYYDDDAVSDGYGITFVLTAGGSLPATRGFKPTPTPGSEYENYVDIVSKNFCVLVFAMSDDNIYRYQETFEVEEIQQVTNGEYHVKGRLNAHYSDFCLVVLTNQSYSISDNSSKPYPVDGSDLKKDETTLADLCSMSCMQYQHPHTAEAAPFVPSEVTPIPMFGLQAYKGTELKDRVMVKLSTPINLMRAMAKIEVTLKDIPVGDLRSICIEGYSKTGYYMPLVTETMNITATDGFPKTVHIPDGAYSSETISFHKTDEMKYVVYVPEYRNTDSGVTPSRIKMQFYDILETKHLDFKEYMADMNNNGSLGDAFDILRNHCYSFTVTRSAGKLYVQFQYQVLDWTKVDNGNLNFGNEDGNARE